MKDNTLDAQYEILPPKISIIVPVYHTEKFLARCLENISSSTLNEIEIIVVDDGSLSSCHDIVNSVQKIDSRISYLRHKKNRGLLEARRTGLNHARGDYIAFLDPDDVISDLIYELAYLRAVKTDAMVVFFNVQQRNEKGHCWTEAYNTIPIFEHWNGSQILDKVLLNHSTAWIWHVSWNKIIRRTVVKKIFESIPRQHLVMFEDLLWSTALYLELKNQFIFSSLKEIGITYNRHDTSATRNRNYKHELKKNSDIFFVLKKLKHLLKSHHEFARYAESYFSTKFQILSRYGPQKPANNKHLYLTNYLLIKLSYWFHMRHYHREQLVPNVSLEKAKAIILRHLDSLNGIKSLSIYGSSELGQSLLEELNERGIKVNYWVSTFSTNEISFNGIPILSPELAIKKGEKNFIIASVGSYTQIRTTLKQLALHSHSEILIIGVA